LLSAGRVITERPPTSDGVIEALDGAWQRREGRASLRVVGHESDLVRNASLHSLAQDFALEGSTEITGALELRLRGGVRSRSSYRRGCPAFYALGGHLFACFQGLYYYTP
jgi:hypothetical protein